MSSKISEVVDFIRVVHVKRLVNNSPALKFTRAQNPILKPATHLSILYADSRDRRKSPGVSGAAISIFADRRDRRLKSLISGMSDIGD